MVAWCHSFCLFCYLFSTNIHSITFIQHILPSPFAEVPLHHLIACQLSGKNLPVVASRESNSGLPYSKPTYYQLSYSAPWLSYAAPLVKLIAKIPVGGLLVFRIVGLHWLAPVGVDCDANLSSLLSKLGLENIYDEFVKGTVSRDFRLLIFFTNQFPPSPRVYH